MRGRRQRLRLSRGEADRDAPALAPVAIQRDLAHGFTAHHHVLLPGQRANCGHGTPPPRCGQAEIHPGRVSTRCQPKLREGRGHVMRRGEPAYRGLRAAIGRSRETGILDLCGQPVLKHVARRQDQRSRSLGAPRGDQFGQCGLQQARSVMWAARPPHRDVDDQRHLDQPMGRGDLAGTVKDIMHRGQQEHIGAKARGVPHRV